LQLLGLLLLGFLDQLLLGFLSLSKSTVFFFLLFAFLFVVRGRGVTVARAFISSLEPLKELLTRLAHGALILSVIEGRVLVCFNGLFIPAQ
jgi:hypothetical protein